MKKVKKIAAYGLMSGLLVVLACTNLDENVYNSIPADQFGQNPDQLAALIGPLYGGLGDYYGNFASLNSVTDEQVVPTRGGDWKDGDQWKRLQQHTWDVTLDDGTFNGLWTWIYNNVTAINQQLVNPAITDQKTISELKTLRAFYHYLAMDNFGNAIIADKILDNGESPQQATRKEMYDFVESEITTALPDLSTDVGGVNYGRMTQYVGNMILAKLYLNAQVYTGTPQWEKAKEQCDAIINSGKFSLAADFFSNFSVNNQNSPEIILATPMDKTKRTGLNPQMATLHYLHQLTYDLGSAPWNGFCTSADFYNSFSDNDIRKKMWIVGQQYDISGNPLTDDNLPMIIKVDIPSFEMPAGADGRLRGARSQKYEIELHNAYTDQDNDFVIYRLADVYLMRGECEFRLGDKSAAVDDFNVIHVLRGLDPYTTTTLTMDEMLAERGRELAWEFHRRQDLIRFGKFDGAWQFNPGSPATREIYPIPKSQLDLNPNLVQNPGY